MDTPDVITAGNLVNLIHPHGSSAQPAGDHGWRISQAGTAQGAVRRDNMRRLGRDSNSRSCTGQHVMLVQQRAIELRAMAAMLASLGCRVTEVTESCRALSYIGRERYDLLISDLDLPLLDGFQLARRIHYCCPQTRILLTTACCHAEVVDLMNTNVVDGWLFKPFRIGVLSEMLDRVIQPSQDIGWSV